MNQTRAIVKIKNCPVTQSTFGIRLTCRYCRKKFAVCCEHYRGQRYCSPLCKLLGTLRRKSRNQKRYRRGAGGRKVSRRNQNAYRKRQNKIVASNEVSDRSSFVRRGHAKAFLRIICDSPNYQKGRRGSSCIVCGRGQLYCESRSNLQQRLDSS